MFPTLLVGIRLADDGPNAVIREPQWMRVYSPDSIAVFDFAAIKLLDSTGEVLHEIKSCKECYVRVTLGKTTIDRGENCDKAYCDRPIFLTVFDREFKPAAEYELPRHKYNPFGGWCSLDETLAFYNDNMFSELESPNIVLDLISFN